MNIVFVCTGNTCRSPMAEGIARDALAALPEGADIVVTSAGLAANEGDDATYNSIKVCADHGIDISSHRSKPLTMSLVAEADKFYTMTRQQAGFLQQLIPDRAEDIAPLFETFDISDPFGSNEGVYESCFIQIEEGIKKRLSEWTTKEDTK